MNRGETMTYTFQQHKYNGIEPKFPIRFDSQEAAEDYKKRLVQRMEVYIERKKSGHKIGEKTLEQLITELEEVKALEIVGI